MSDEADQSDARIAETVEYGLAQVRKRMAARMLQPVGVCHSPLCGDAVTGMRLFCNKDCSDDWERANEAKVRSGK